MSCFRWCGSADFLKKSVDHHQRTDQSVVVQTQQHIAVAAIPADELRDITDNFGSKALIGKSSYGRVFYAVLKSSKAAAIKKLDDSSKYQEFISKISIVSILRHDNVIPLVGYCVDVPLRVIVYEYAPNGSLHDILHGRKGVLGAVPGPVLTWQQRVKIAVGAAQGLEYLHEKVNPKVIHGNIKSSNILLFDDDVAKIADIDLSDQDPDMAVRPFCSGGLGRGLGATDYKAPEYIMTGILTKKSDVFSFGVVLLELLTGRKPVDHSLPRGQQSLVRWSSLLLRKPILLFTS
ncbi:unnamed protein product [Eruca vesicaria subsp. sativa]|uniref:Protein kinase domain-containing protein n=1 Tax=Eruca vesicaria subsp. sativa TaxID=29727 RepID=A0ABC8K4F6_ERUVS|nr:unnamed protein product [Eruca vesicaria subsp. sativa]